MIRPIHTYRSSRRNRARKLKLMWREADRYAVRQGGERSTTDARGREHKWQPAEHFVSVPE